MAVKVEVDVPEGSKLEEAVNDDVAKFEQYFINNVDGSVGRLMNAERAIIKTYLWWKTHPEETRG